jgi:hypothetical protein
MLAFRELTSQLKVQIQLGVDASNLSVKSASPSRVKLLGMIGEQPSWRGLLKSTLEQQEPSAIRHGCREIENGLNQPQIL